MKKQKESTESSSSTVLKNIAPMIVEIKSNPIVISDIDTMTKATEYLSQANKNLDALTKDKELLTKPINESLKAIRAKYKPTETALEDIIASIRQEMSRYQTEQIRIQKEEQDKIANRIGEGRGKIKMETAIAKMDSLPQVINKTSTESGSLTFRPTSTLKIIDPIAIPRKYLIIDEVALLTALKAGIVVEGAEIEIIQVPINKRI